MSNLFWNWTLLTSPQVAAHLNNDGMIPSVVSFAIDSCEQCGIVIDGTNDVFFRVPRDAINKAVDGAALTPEERRLRGLP
jgi:hypothetical protein